MATRTIRLPDVGEGVTEAELTELLVKVGDLVREDDPIAAVMTDKATVEITSAYAGRVVWIGGAVGKTLAIGCDLLRIDDGAAGTDGACDPGADPSSDAAAEAPAASGVRDPVLSGHGPLASLPEPPAACPRAAPATFPERAVLQGNAAGGIEALSDSPPPRAEGAPVLAAPAVRARARDGGIDLRRVAGSGPAGRITHADLDALFDRAGHPGGSGPISRPVHGRGPSRPSALEETIETVKVAGLRRVIARRMSEANASIPHITVIEEVDMTELETLRGHLNESRGERPKLTPLPLIAMALVKARQACPTVFARYDDVAETIEMSNAVYIGIATMTEAGLMVPVLRHAEALDPFALSAEIGRLAEACRSGKAKREELGGSTITISSLGALGALAATPIINKPEVAILGVNRMAMRPNWNGTTFVPRMMMNISASFDHRIIDGWDAALFVRRIKTLLETPALIFVGD